MEATDLLFAVLGPVLAGILATAGYGGIAVSPADFKKARICFCLAAAVLGGIPIVWGFTTIHPVWARLLITAAFGAVAVSGLTEALRWVAEREQWQSPAAPAASVPVAAAPAPKPTKFYSKEEKEKLGTLCRQLQELFVQNGGDGGGDGVYSKMTLFGNEWNTQRANIINNRPADIDKLSMDGDEARKATSAMYNALYGEHSITYYYSGYVDEINLLLGENNQANNPNNKIKKISQSYNEFLPSIEALSQSLKHEDNMLMRSIVQSVVPAFRDMQAGIGIFQRWEFDTVQRIKNFRENLSN